MAEIEILPEPYGSPISRPLTDAQGEELAYRYGGWEGADGEPEPKQFEQPDGFFLVAWQGDRAGGCGGILRFDDLTAELRRMFVAPDARRRGIGQMLVARLEATARELGYERIRLETGVRQPDAQGLYERAGFEPIPNYGVFVGERRSICMEKRM